MRHPGWLLVVAGLVICGIGFVWIFGPSIPGLGRLPGDIAIERGNSRFYFPVTTCLVVSALLTFVLWVVRWLSR